MSSKTSEIKIISCMDVDNLLFQYVEGELSQTLGDLLQKHINNCPDCRHNVDSYQQVISMARLLSPCAYNKNSKKIKGRLFAALEKELQIKFNTSSLKDRTGKRPNQEKK